MQDVAEAALGRGGYDECVDCGGTFRDKDLVACSSCVTGSRCRDCDEAHQDDGDHDTGAST